MKIQFTWPILILLLALTGCAHHRTADEHAKAFFGDGRHYILKSLKRQGASPEQLDQAKAVLDRDEATVTRNLAATMRAQQDVLFAVTTGKDSATLAPLDSNAHLKQTQAVQSIGQMHESLQATVGPALWQASMLDMEKKMSRYIRK